MTWYQDPNFHIIESKNKAHYCTPVNDCRMCHKKLLAIFMVVGTQDYRPEDWNSIVDTGKQLVVDCS